jgi:hypothetical protein
MIWIGTPRGLDIKTMRELWISRSARNIEEEAIAWWKVVIAIDLDGITARKRRAIGVTIAPTFLWRITSVSSSAHHIGIDPSIDTGVILPC